MIVSVNSKYRTQELRAALHNALAVHAAKQYYAVALQDQDVQYVNLATCAEGFAL